MSCLGRQVSVHEVGQLGLDPPEPRVSGNARPISDTLGTSPGQLTTTKVSDSGKSLAVEKVLGQSHHLLAKNRTKHVL